MVVNSVLYYLWRNAKECPEKTALSDEQTSITYAEYKKAAVKIASGVIEKFSSGQIKRPVAVLIDRNVLSVLAFMGIACSGNFYVPLDPSMPEERRNTILKELSPLGVLDARDEGKELQTAGYPCIPVKELLQEEILPEKETQVETICSQIIDTDPLYSIFTSGSTGVPKGVLICHRSVVDLVRAFEDAFGFDETSVFGNQAPFDFDVSVKDLYNALYCRGRVEIIPKKKFVMPKLLVEYLAEKEINTIIWAVSAVRIVSDFRTLDEVQTEKPLSLRYVMFSGEVMPVKALNYWMEHYPEVTYVNLYGPTEITCNCTYYVIDRKYEPGDMLPVGKAFKNTRVFLLDGQGNPILEKDKVGEICVEGTGLAAGYWNNPQKTAECFVSCPGSTEYENKIYRTGDMGYYDEEGKLYFAARADSQIKHMGHRIELGEIEAALGGIGFMRAAICFYDQQDEKIICYYQAEGAEDGEELKDLRKQITLELQKKLPKYMWPNRYIRLAELPMSSHGKIDRVKLREWYRNGAPGPGSI